MKLINLAGAIMLWMASATFAADFMNNTTMSNPSSAGSDDSQAKSITSKNASGQSHTTIIDENGNLKIVPAPKAETPTGKSELPLGASTGGMQQSQPAIKPSMPNTNAGPLNTNSGNINPNMPADKLTPSAPANVGQGQAAENSNPGSTTDTSVGSEPTSNAGAGETNQTTQPATGSAMQKTVPADVNPTNQ